MFGYTVSDSLVFVLLFCLEGWRVLEDIQGKKGWYIVVSLVTFLRSVLGHGKVRGDSSQSACCHVVVNLSCFRGAFQYKEKLAEAVPSLPAAMSSVCHVSEECFSTWKSLLRQF